MDSLSDKFASLRSYECATRETVIRRYLDSTKFNDLIISKELRFSPASEFEEKEGHYTMLDHQSSDDKLRRFGLDASEREIAGQARQTVARNNRRSVVISCWTIGADENQRMWDEYGKDANAIAIETTVGALRTAIGPSFLFVPVKYIDDLHDHIPKSHSLEPFFYKRNEPYGWEQELRIVGEMEIGKRIGSPRRVRLDLASVLTKLIIAPTADHRRLGQIRSQVLSSSLMIPVMPSSLTQA
jgi:hypothetical protein